MSEVIELDRLPATVDNYRRAARGLLTRRAPGDLPDATLVVRDLPVSRTALSAYNSVCGFRQGDRLPATYPQIMVFPLALRLMSGADFPFPVVGVVHVGNRIEQVRPIDAAERLEFAVRAADLRPHRRGRQFDLRMTASVGDEVVWRAVATYLRRTKPGQPGTPPPDGSTPEQADASGQAGSSDADSSGVPAPQPTAIWRVPQSVGRSYARVSGDHNPIHVSRLGARAFGFRRPIAHGMWSLARCLAALDGRLPDRYTVEVSFKLPIALPATVGFSATPARDGWRLWLGDTRTSKPHLYGTINDA